MSGDPADALRIFSEDVLAVLRSDFRNPLDAPTMWALGRRRVWKLDQPECGESPSCSGR